MSASAPIDSSELMPDEVRVCYLRTEGLIEPRLLARCRQMLLPDELQRAGRFYFEEDQHTFLLARALVRTMLSQAMPVDPRVWRFRTNPYGRPEIDEPQSGRWLRFNVSHTRGLVACGVTRERDLGVDVEDLTRMQGDLELARRYFSPNEVAELSRVPPQQQHDAFFDYWTLKESYIKARGMGLSLPLEKFSFRFEADRSVTISFASELQDDSTSWQFLQARPTPRHKLAVAVRRQKGESVQIVVQETAL